MLWHIQNELGVRRRPVVRFLLTPPGAEYPRGLPDDPGDLVTEYFVVVAVVVDALNTDVGAQVNGVADAARAGSAICIWALAIPKKAASRCLAKRSRV